MRPLLVVAACATVLLAAPSVAAAQTQTDTTPTVAADGIGSATLKPDIADFTVAVRESARSSSAARGAANRVVAAIVKVANGAGVVADDIRTVGLTVSRTRVKPKHKPAYTRYNARQYLEIRVRDLNKLGPLLDATTDAGADQVEGPDFGFADPSAGRLLATRAALADARRRADDAAAATGLRITGVRSVVLAPDSSDDGYSSPTSGGSGDSASSKAVSTPTSVSPGTQQFNERVRVVYTAAPV